MKEEKEEKIKMIEWNKKGCGYGQNKKHRKEENHDRKMDDLQ